MGLDEIFGTVKTQILSTKPMPSLGTTYHLVAEDEQQRTNPASRRTTSDVAAYQVRNQMLEKINQEKRVKSHEGSKCKHCGKNGHIIDGCFEKIGYPDWWDSH